MSTQTKRSSRLSFSNYGERFDGRAGFRGAAGRGH